MTRCSTKDWEPSKASRRILNCKMVLSLYFAKPGQYSTPCAKKVEEELDRLESQGVVKKVERSDWASPIVCIVCQRKTEVFVSVGISRCPLTEFF